MSEPMKKGVPFWRYGLLLDMLWRVPRWWLFYRHEWDYTPWDYLDHIGKLPK